MRERLAKPGPLDDGAVDGGDEDGADDDGAHAHLEMEDWLTLQVLKAGVSFDSRNEECANSGDRAPRRGARQRRGLRSGTRLLMLRCRASGFRTASGSLTCHARAGLPRRAHRQFFTPTLHALQRKQCVPYSSEQVYAVVSDVERYAEFLPFCSASRICARHGPASFDATLTLGFLAFSETYTSRVTLEPPRGVTAVATDTTLFSHLSTRWRLTDGREPGTCELHFVLEMQLKSILQDQVRVSVRSPVRR